MKVPYALAALALCFGLALALPAAPARASDQQDTVDSARNVIERLRTGNDGIARNARDLIHRSRAVLVVPDLVKAGFFLGGAGGNGVLLARGKDGGWSYPAFYGMGSGSFGLQIGVEVSRIVFIVMTEKGLNAVMHNDFKFGAEAGIAVATLGAGGEAATTTNLRADIYAIAESKGLFGGIAVEGAVMKTQPSWNHAYYGREVSLSEILLQRRVRNPGANALRASLSHI